MVMHLALRCCQKKVAALVVSMPCAFPSLSSLPNTSAPLLLPSFVSPSPSFLLSSLLVSALSAATLENAVSHHELACYCLDIHCPHLSSRTQWECPRNNNPLDSVSYDHSPDNEINIASCVYCPRACTPQRARAQQNVQASTKRVQQRSNKHHSCYSHQYLLHHQSVRHNCLVCILLEAFSRGPIHGIQRARSGREWRGKQ